MLYMHKSTYLYFDRAEQNEIKHHKNNEKKSLYSRLLMPVGLLTKFRFTSVDLTSLIEGKSVTASLVKAGI